jgi:hypothetical protein
MLDSRFTTPGKFYQTGVEKQRHGIHAYRAAMHIQVHANAQNEHY